MIERACARHKLTSVCLTRKWSVELSRMTSASMDHNLWSESRQHPVHRRCFSLVTSGHINMYEAALTNRGTFGIGIQTEKENRLLWWWLCDILPQPPPQLRHSQWVRYMCVGAEQLPVADHASVIYVACSPTLDVDRLIRPGRMCWKSEHYHCTVIHLSVETILSSDGRKRAQLWNMKGMQIWKQSQTDSQVHCYDIQLNWASGDRWQCIGIGEWITQWNYRVQSMTAQRLWNWLSLLGVHWAITSSSSRHF